MTHTTVQVSAEQFRALYADVSAWNGGPAGGEGAQSDALQRGALRYLTTDRIAAAARLVRTGVTVRLGRPLDTQAALDNPAPAVHLMTMLPEDDGSGAPLRFAKDYVGADYHNDTHSHLDAFCHVAYERTLYNGHPDTTVSSRGAEYGTIELLDNGLVGRGVLLDIPAVRDVPWLEPGDNVFRADLEAAEAAQGVRVEAGDVLLVRTGHARRLAELGPWDTARAKAGLHPTAVPFLAERRVTALGSDGNSDTAPSNTEGVGFPIHVLTLNAMGVHLLDYLQFEDLLPACRSSGVWEFLFVATPLRIPGGTGLPVNPVAIL